MARSRASKRIMGLAKKVLSLKNVFLRLFIRRIGRDTVIYPNFHFLHGKNLEIGNHVRFNNNNFINAMGGVVIKDYASFGPNTVIHTGRHIYEDPDKPIRHQGDRVRKITIGRDVLVSANCVILADIGDGSVIGAGAVVNRDIPPYSVAVGVPAKVIKKRKPAKEKKHKKQK